MFMNIKSIVLCSVWSLTTMQCIRRYVISDAPYPIWSILAVVSLLMVLWEIHDWYGHGGEN